MSKLNENDHLKNDPDPNTGGNSKPPNKKTEHPTIEEHAKNQSIDAPVFAAVMESQKWVSGKRVPVAAFERAVKEFLCASMGGSNGFTRH